MCCPDRQVQSDLFIFIAGSDSTVRMTKCVFEWNYQLGKIIRALAGARQRVMAAQKGRDIKVDPPSTPHV